MLKIAILGSRGIPNYYGGFEQCAEFLAVGFVQNGHDVTVYNSHNHPYKEEEWEKVKIVHCYDPEDQWGTAGQFIYDFNCIRHARTAGFDIILQLGYTSSSIWGWLLPGSSIVTTNMDGLEWKRTKYSKPVRWFLKRAEYLGTVFSDYWIADSLGIQQYLREKYKLESAYIPYGAIPFETPDIERIVLYNVEPYKYDMLIARLEPENNIDTILEAVTLAASERQFLVIGKHDTKYGAYLKDKYKSCQQIRFVGGIYDIGILNNLRFHSNIYFHGHTVGGTNPSLLEAMASQALICAHDNAFNATILEKDAFYFNNPENIAQILRSVTKQHYSNYLAANLEKIKTIYGWKSIIDQYESHLIQIKDMGKRKNFSL